MSFSNCTKVIPENQATATTNPETAKAIRANFHQDISLPLKMPWKISFSPADAQMFMAMYSNTTRKNKRTGLMLILKEVHPPFEGGAPLEGRDSKESGKGIISTSGTGPRLDAIQFG